MEQKEKMFKSRGRKQGDTMMYLRIRSQGMYNEAQQLREMASLPKKQAQFSVPTWNSNSKLICNLSSRGIWHLFLASMDTKHAHVAQTYMQANAHPYKIVITIF